MLVIERLSISLGEGRVQSARFEPFRRVIERRHMLVLETSRVNFAIAKISYERLVLESCSSN